MGRINLLANDLFRVKITRETPEGDVVTTAIGPYLSERAARSRIKHDVMPRNGGASILEAVVEAAVARWDEVPVGDESQSLGDSKVEDANPIDPETGLPALSDGLAWRVVRNYHSTSGSLQIVKPVMRPGEPRTVEVPNPQRNWWNKDSQPLMVSKTMQGDPVLEWEKVQVASIVSDADIQSLGSFSSSFMELPAITEASIRETARRMIEHHKRTVEDGRKFEAKVREVEKLTGVYPPKKIGDSV